MNEVNLTWSAKLLDTARVRFVGTFVALFRRTKPIQLAELGPNLAEVIEAHEGSDALATITLTHVEDPTAYGLVEVDHRLWVKRFVEKPGSDEVGTSLVNAGIYVLERELLEMTPEGREVSIERRYSPSSRPRGGFVPTSPASTGATSGRLAATLRRPTISSLVLSAEGRGLVT